MPTITSIKPQKNKKRVNIYLDDKFGFGLDLENFVKLGLKAGQELSEDEIEEIVKSAEFTKTYEKLLKFAMLRPRSSWEIHKWFSKHKVHESIRGKLVGKLEKLELVDDYKFAKWWVEQRLLFKLKSKRELIFELRNKGIDKNIIDDVIDESGLNEYENARKLLEKNRYKWDKHEDLAKRKKMSEYLLRKGYSWSAVKKAVDSFFD